MPLIKDKEYVAAPEGLHNAVCVDVTPVQMKQTKFGEKPKFRIVWEIEAKMDDGRPFLVSNEYTVSAHEKSILRKHLKGWRGRDFTEEELKEGYDPEVLVGHPCQVLIQHNSSKGKTFANVVALMKPGESKLSATGKYKRWKDRQLQTEDKLKDSADFEPDDIPFEWHRRTQG